MLLNEFLFEAKSEKSQKEEILIKNLADQIKKECKPFLKDNMSQILNGKYLCHSTELTSELRYDEGKISYDIKLRDDREPRDTDKDYHDAANDYLEHKFGVRFRSKSIFTFPNFANKGYGDPFVVFPVGDYKVCYSPKVYDAYNEVFEGSFKTSSHRKEFVKTTNIVDEVFGSTKFGKFLMSYVDELSKDVRASIYQDMLREIIELEVFFNSSLMVEKTLEKIFWFPFAAAIISNKQSVKKEFCKRIGLESDVRIGSDEFDKQMLHYFRESPEMKADYKEFIQFISSIAKKKTVFTSFFDFLNYSTDPKNMFDKSRMEVMVHAESVILVKKSHYKKLLNHFKSE